MITSKLARTAGWLLIVSFVLCLVGGMAHPIVAGNAHSADSLTSAASPYAQYLLLAGTVCLLMGLPILYSNFADRLGRLGLVGTVLYLIGNATCAMAHLVVEAMVAVPLAANPATRHLIPGDGSLFASPGFQLSQMVGGPVLLLGQILLGVAVIRSRSLPRWPGVLLIVGGVLALVPLPEVAVLAGVLFELPRGLAVAALGWMMIKEHRTGRTAVPVAEHQLA